MAEGKPDPRPFFGRLSYGLVNLFEGPATYFREKIVLPNRGEPYPWYHRRYRRVPEIDECYMDDFPCIYEAEQQFKRDKRVEANIIRILRRRVDDCMFREQADHKTRCAKVVQDFNEAEINLFIKYGDMGLKQSAQMALMKQKHRLIIERRKRENYIPNPPKFVDRENYFNRDDFTKPWE